MGSGVLSYVYPVTKSTQILRSKLINSFSHKFRITKLLTFKLLLKKIVQEICQLE